MTFKQFEEQLHAYAFAFSVRDRRLLKIFFVLFGLAVATTISVAFVSKNSISFLFKIILGAMTCLAVYTVISSRQFHKRYGVRCNKCGASLTAFGETLEMIEAGEIERPLMLKCPRCKEVVVKDDV